MVTLAGDSATVLIVSDHGFGPAPARRLNINNWLMGLGLLSLNTRVDRVTSLSHLNLCLGRNRRLKSLLKRLLPESIQRTIQERDRGKSGWLIDWSKTKAYGYPLYANVCGIMINQKGMKREGIVAPGLEYESLRDRLIDEAKQIIDPQSGQPVVKAAYRREELYEGKFVGSFPDIVLILGSEYSVSASMMHGGIVIPRSDQLYTGDHRQEGVFFISGFHVRRSQLNRSVEIVDIAPTVLYLLGVEIPDDMDGRVLVEVFEDSYVQTIPPKYVPVPPEPDSHEIPDEEVYSDEEEEDIRERLRSLGYLS
jgi:predicted AlkP superfamily phosphohydrolase/phosphomutase